MRPIENLKNKADGFVIGTMIAISQVAPSLASEDIFDVAGNVFTEVYAKLREISTPVCAALICISLLIAHFGDQKATDGGRKAALGIIITWCIINGLGFIMNFVTKAGGFGEGATWTGAVDIIVNSLIMVC